MQPWQALQILSSPNINVELETFNNQPQLNAIKHFYKVQLNVLTFFKC